MLRFTLTIAWQILSVTCDNASSNDTMIDQLALEKKCAWNEGRSPKYVYPACDGDLSSRLSSDPRTSTQYHLKVQHIYADDANLTYQNFQTFTDRSICAMHKRDGVGIGH
jgi:hypothetical protein